MTMTIGTSLPTSHTSVQRQVSPVPLFVIFCIKQTAASVRAGKNLGFKEKFLFFFILTNKVMWD